MALNPTHEWLFNEADFTTAGALDVNTGNAINFDTVVNDSNIKLRS